MRVVPAIGSIRQFSLKVSIKDFMDEAKETEALQEKFEGFDVLHESGSAIIELKKELEKETITVRADVRAGISEDSDLLNEDLEGKDGEEIEDRENTELRFDVHVTKPSSTNELTFECVLRADEDEFEITDIAFGPEEVDEDDYTHVPAYRFTDEIVEDLYVYLEERGVNNDLACFLADSAELVHEKELKNVLGKVDEFLEQ
eukprot:CAMPEP_0184480762 /NCGR_PEP_ID=MMETSP0113_2-20130426/2292_1 /TAXON_ID=91329 /ORGANISM="Norrisiella sphaerica, Strain BC52" /LENGTH=201 /DNA_ID=CAMNT_0026859475 /DNA_START=111 /DNA_END=716 /DNA_ORIENTATION=+